MTFDWGDLVSVASEAPLEYRPGSRAWIVGMHAVDAGSDVHPPGGGRKLYTIEFEDGSSVEVPVILLLSVSEA
jgi:hypothetical protein